MMNDALIATYAAILNEEKEVAFLIEGTESLAVISENVGHEDANWNVDVYLTDTMNHFIPTDGGVCSGNERDAIEMAVSMYEQLIHNERGR